MSAGRSLDILFAAMLEDGGHKKKGDALLDALKGCSKVDVLNKVYAAFVLKMMQNQIERIFKQEPPTRIEGTALMLPIKTKFAQYIATVTLGIMSALKDRSCPLEIVYDNVRENEDDPRMPVQIKKRAHTNQYDVYIGNVDQTSSDSEFSAHEHVILTYSEADFLEAAARQTMAKPDIFATFENLATRTCQEATIMTSMYFPTIEGGQYIETIALTISHIYYEIMRGAGYSAKDEIMELASTVGDPSLYGASVPSTQKPQIRDRGSTPKKPKGLGVLRGPNNSIPLSPTKSEV